ncbi:MAG: hypothetical protein ABUT20_18355, partial [Bacteroidota bacterium]
MKQSILILFLAVVLLTSCNNSGTEKTADATVADSTTASTVDPAKDWKFGVALWTFHTFNFPQSLDKVDSAGIKYIEPNTFHKAGPELKDSLILQLSPAGIEKLKQLVAQKGLMVKSIYIVGDSTILSWKKQFDIA